MPPSATASIGEKSKVLVEAGHVAPRAEKRKIALEAYKKGVAGGHKKTCPIGTGMLQLLSQATRCRETVYLLANVLHVTNNKRYLAS